MAEQLLDDVAAFTAYRLLEEAADRLTNAEWQRTYEANYGMTRLSLEVAFELYRVQLQEPSRN